MDDRTLDYLKGRFSDYYSSVNLPKVKHQEERELAYASWNGVFHRHMSVESVEEISKKLSREEPRHVYLSASRFKYPGVEDNDRKDWLGSDLVFDFDSKDLPQVNKDDSHSEKLEKCKQELLDLVSVIENDLGFEEYYIKFSGNQGYHVHVTEEQAQDLGKRQRIQISDYIQGKNLSLEDVVSEDPWYGSNIKSFQPGGYWQQNYYDNLYEFTQNIESNKNRLLELDGVGEKTVEDLVENSSKIINFMEKGMVVLSSSKIDKLLNIVLDETKRKDAMHIDQPVTTDVNRLMRLNDSIHGGSGLLSMRVEDIDSFEPVKDAIPEKFEIADVEVTINEDCEIERYNKYEFKEGETREVPEYVGISLMCEGKAKLD